MLIERMALLCPSPWRKEVIVSAEREIPKDRARALTKSNERGKNMRRDTSTVWCRWGLVVVICSLTLVASMSIPAVATAQTAGAVCSIRVSGNGLLMSVFTLLPTNLATTATVPADKDVLMPVLCDDLDAIGLGVANQEKSREVTFDVQVYDHTGIKFCDKGLFTLFPQGAAGVTFASCQKP
jgi:hypothetical protein